MKKKIVIIGPAHPLRGGLASFDERLAREFNYIGLESTIFTFSLQYPNFLFPGTTQYSSEPKPEDIDIKVCINSINPLNWVKVAATLKRLKPDIIVVRYWLPFMGPCLGTILRIAKKNGRTKIVCIADNIIPHEKRIGDKYFTDYFIKPVDQFICMSESVLNDIKTLSPSKPVIKVDHPLYDNFGAAIDILQARRYLSIAADAKVILFFGFIRNYKGLDILYEAMKILSEKYPSDRNIKLLVAGEYYENPAPYLKQIEDLGLQEKLILHTEFIADSDIKYYLCAADVVIQPYRSATQSGVTPLAYHFEIPMIVTNVGGLPSMIVENKVGLIAEPNPESIAEKIHEYFETGKEFFLPYLKEEKKRFSWRILADAITK